MRIEEYTEECRQPLRIMLDMYFNEINPDRSEELRRDIDLCDEAITTILQTHSIYVLVTDEGSLIGFMSCFINNEYGMVEPYLVCEYQYILPNFRNGIAVATMTHALSELCVRLQLPIINTTYNTASSKNNVERLGAKQLATVSYLTLEDATNIYKKYTKRINR